MLKRIHWIDNSVLSVRLHDGLFTLAQMRVNHLMEFFDIRSNGNWEEIDLNAVPVLFTNYVAENRLRPLFVERLAASKVKNNTRPIQRKMLSFIVKSENCYGADLVEISEDFSSVNAGLLKADLSPTEDLAKIHAHELTGMVGDPEKLRARLIRFFETGINWDESKSFLFPQIELPAPKLPGDA